VDDDDDDDTLRARLRAYVDERRTRLGAWQWSTRPDLRAAEERALDELERLLDGE
jgi:hypothetical protein